MKLSSLFTRLSIMFRERTWQKRLHYLFEPHHSRTLVIVFSGFAGKKPRYNYVRTLKRLKADKLFLLDDFAWKGSYYWFSQGTDLPERLVSGLIEELMDRNGYTRVVSMGSSKGGTCALYYGLKMGLNDIYAAACQYHIGAYLNIPPHQRIFRTMMGGQAGEAEQTVLDTKMPEVLRASRGTSTSIHLFYSRQDPTYAAHIRDLIADLDSNNLAHIDTVVDFDRHEDVGYHFGPWVLHELQAQSDR